MDDDEELQLSLHLDGQYKTATLPKGLYHAATHSGWKIARHCIIIVFDVIIECQRINKIIFNSKANAKIEYQAIISGTQILQILKYNLFHRTFKTNLRALQGNMYIGEVTVFYTCGVFVTYI